MNTWPDGGMTPFRSEKNTNWEGAFRVPEMIRWPGQIAAGIDLQRDRRATTTGCRRFWPRPASRTSSRSSAPVTPSARSSFKVHIDGFNLLPYLTGETEHSPRPGFVYFSDDGDLLALRFDNWKLVFMEQRVLGTLQVWAEPFVALRVPKMFNLRTDPFERADITSNTYWDWLLDHAFLVLAAQTLVGEFLATFAGVPAAPEGGELHHRPGHGAAGGGHHLGP